MSLCKVVKARWYVLARWDVSGLMESVTRSYLWALEGDSPDSWEV